MAIHVPGGPQRREVFPRLSTVIASHELASSYVGTWQYMSTEVLGGERYSFHSDIWSLGCVIYELASRIPWPRAVGRGDRNSSYVGTWQYMPLKIPHPERYSLHSDI